ncbi:hypothetical protein C9374_013446 [Naegleria lovaniensis]|uniref:Zn(2)-C6 fungal-type domain-containing protein n=1 Tax=Naegleria lovaniensis TaxID=51637 RepID=A0AA88H2P8_NAELO|nr:uncharacterized protein C9374_013446 [Naegleria lovaniensis]KAG2391961.1 hypothetical protein C9374_013446 [Naegleria lovaniensis]
MSSSSSTHSQSPTELSDRVSGGGEESMLHPIACLVCRKGHRKCDRALPGCMQCKLKGKECRYPEPMKRGPPKTAMQPYPSTTTTTTSDSSSPVNGKIAPSGGENSLASVQEEQPINFQIVDMYFDIISLGCPILQRSVMMDIVSKNPLGNNNAPEEVALMYAIQANCYQRLGRKIEGRTAFNTSRKYLAQVFDILDNFAIAGTFMYLASFCMGEAEFNQSRYYLGSVQFFVTQNKQRLKDNLHFIHLCKIFMYLQLILEEEEALDMLNEDMKNSDQLHANVVTTEKLTLQVFHFKKMIDFFMFITQNISDGQCGSSSNNTIPPPQFSSAEDEQMMQSHWQLIYGIPTQFNRSRSEASSTIRQVTKLMYLLMIDGVRLGILTKSQAQSDDIVIETANRISDFTTLSYFSYMPPHVSVTILNAARIHLSLIKQIQRGERANNGVDYYEYLKKDQRALNLMAERFTIAEKRFKYILPMINEELMKRDQQIEQQIHTMIGTNPADQLQNQLLAIIPEDIQAISQLHDIIGAKDVELNMNVNSYTDVARSSLNIHTVPDSMGHENPFVMFLGPNFDISQVTISPLSKENFYSDPQQYDPNNL